MKTNDMVQKQARRAAPGKIAPKPAGLLGGKMVYRVLAGSAPERKFALDQRSAGVLMHLTSLPGPHGSGDLGAEARKFADFLSASGQRWWQMLPVTPLGAAPGYSPYSSDSAIAGNPYLVSLEILVEEGLLKPDELGALIPSPGTPGEGRGRGISAFSVQRSAFQKAPTLTLPRSTRGGKNVNHADFRYSIHFRERSLRLAFEHFSHFNGPVHRAFEEFCERERDWLIDYALFCALKNATGGKPWHAWEKNLRQRKPDAIAEARRALASEIEFHQFAQYQFDRQWRSFREYCASRGIGLIGDIPIFVAHDSADVWAHRHLFDLDRAGHPQRVTGYPPDIFNSAGQKWGHPHFDWTQHKAENYRWWLRRFQTTFDKFDAVRIDHFLGFDRCWAIPSSCPDARKGRWIPGAGADFFRAVRKELGEGCSFIVEDLGELVPSAIALRDEFKLPGMRVLQMAFDNTDYHCPHVYPRHSVAYTGTHDNDTILGWYEKLLASSKNNPTAQSELARAQQYIGPCDHRNIHWAFVRSLYVSQSDTVIIPMQDLLGLGTEHRMNIPGTCEGNWTWRLPDRAITNDLANRLRQMSELFGRA